MVAAPALDIHDLKKGLYDQEAKGEKEVVEALKGVSLRVERGEFYAFLGPNGAGKTTLISIVAGLALKSSGTVEVCGVSIDADHDKAKSFIGLVPQEFNFNWFETVLAIVVNQAGYYGIPRKEACRELSSCLRTSVSGRSAIRSP